VDAKWLPYVGNIKGFQACSPAPSLEDKTHLESMLDANSMTGTDERV